MAIIKRKGKRKEGSEYLKSVLQVEYKNKNSIYTVIKHFSPANVTMGFTGAIIEQWKQNQCRNEKKIHMK